ncbi:hypothetical protein [Halomonas sp. PBN3]|uniref:hypothetical protein n=1 Tax=Halomonas sp. PBN3 TaxID=1397528 RepID=UPI0003B8BB6B|nr:hypothetical protein [Halomonas sp. PBN3]ERS87711.1 hypothetical protein Q671_01910 [Halomonas sp. PBN3]
MSIKTTLSAALAAGTLAFGAAALADNHGGEAEEGKAMDDKALVILTSDSLETQGMAMILANAMQQQGTDLQLLLCDQAGELAVEGYQSAQPINTPPSNPAGQVTPEGIMQMLMGNGAQVDVCAIYLPNRDYGEEVLREGVGIAAPGPIAELMRDPSVPVFTF